ncbi:apolipoprotein F [Emydura macquarii macquarii]|uniref:apolipoprotein F n=1 Tax=Emydura macquarii macquarii TaxID=1129001 RepID=UPI00352B1456
MRLPLLCCCLLLLGHELHGHLLPPSGGDAATGTIEPPEMEVGPVPASPNASSAHQAAARVLLDSLSGWLPRPGLPREGVSCQDLLPEALEGFAELPPLPQTLASLALALSLHGAGCPGQAEALVVQLYGEVGMEDVNALLLGLAGAPRRGGRGQAALLFNLDQLAGASPRRCSGLARLDGFLLLGPVASAHAAFPAATAACRRLGSACAGLAANSTTSFLVIGQPGAYSLPGRGAQAWLHRCSQAGRSRRGSPEACSSEQEREVHGVLQWVPMVSTFYNMGTGIYYTVQNCTELAKERALEAALDLGYDTLVALTGGAGGGVGFAVGVGLKPAVKAGVQSLVRYFKKAETS